MPSPAVNLVLAPAFSPYRVPGLVGAFDAADLNSLTFDASNRVSQWSDKSGLGHHLLQATGSAQALLLPWRGTNYLYLSGVSGNDASAPDSAALSITGDIDIRVWMAATDWTPSAATPVIAKGINSAGHQSYQIQIASGSTGIIQMLWWDSGATLRFASSTVAPTIADFSALWIRATLDVDNGAAGNTVTFYTSPDGITWTQLGAAVTQGFVTTIQDTDATLRIGSNTGTYATGGIYRAQIYNGIAGALVFDADCTRVAHNATSFTEMSSNAATVTINKSGAIPAQIVGRSSVLFDGSAYNLKATDFTMSLPATVVLIGKQNTWTDLRCLVDLTGGAATGQAQIRQTTSGGIAGSPRIAQAFTGGTTLGVDTFVLGQNHVVSSVMTNAAGSFMRIDRTAGESGTQTTVVIGGLTLGGRWATSAVDRFANFQVQKLFLFSAALDVATLDKIAVWAGKQEGIVV